MLDYEGIKYLVKYKPNGGRWSVRKLFDTEEEVIEFIKANRDGWEKYRLIKQIDAIIDF